MIKAVLFDMDATLLDINLNAFMFRYVKDLSRMLAYISGKSSMLIGAAYVQSFLAVQYEGRTDGLTNGELFSQEMDRRVGVPLKDPAVLDAIACYEKDVLPTYKGGIVNAHPMEGGLAAIERAQEMGLTVALATNPSFSEPCIRMRMEWAGIADVPFARVSHLDNSTRMKPSSRYYEEFVSALGLAPNECLMVGNDASRDFPRPYIGMETAYVGHARPSRAAWSGRMSELADALPALVDRLDLQG